MSLNSMRNSFHSSAKWILGVVTIAMLFTAYTGIGSILNNRMARANVSPTQAPDAPVATVDGIAITRREYDSAYNMAKQQAAMFQQGAQSVVMQGQTRLQALDQIVSKDEAVEVAQKAGVTASEDDIQKAREGKLASLRQQLGLKAGASEDEINSALANYNGATVDQIFPDADLRKDVLMQKYQDQVKKTAIPTDEAVKAYYRQVHTRHILIGNTTRPDAQAKDQAQQLIAKIKGGADFAALARQYSDDPGSKNKGGDDGWISETTPYVPEFLKAALALQPNQVTPEPILSPKYGYFIIQSLGDKDTTPKDYAKNKAKYDQQVAQALQNQTEQQAFSQVQQAAKVVVTDPLLHAYKSLLQPSPGQTPKTAQTAALADFQRALSGADYSTKAEIYAQMAQIYQAQNDTKQEIDALNNALNGTEDAQLRLMLGDAYRKSGDVNDALAQYKQASDGAYDNPGVHIQLQQTYKTMNRTDLVKAEQDWMKQYTARQQQARAAQTPPTIPGGGRAVAVTPQAVSPKK